MTNEELTILAEKVSAGRATVAELALYSAACDAFQKEEVAWPGMEGDLVEMEHASLQRLWNEQEVELPKKLKLWPGVRVAVGIAAAVATVVFGVWFFAYREVASSLAPRSDDWAKNDVAPGKSGATITLSTGEVIQLSGEKKGVVIANGQISYSSSGVNPSLRGTKQSPGNEIASLPRNDGQGGNVQGGNVQGGNGQGGNPQGPSSGINPSLRGTKQSPVELTASTAKGQTYEFTLPDGTHVWLNADSKISFPSQFSGKERKILLKGEAYFAVVHNAKQPFRVESKGQVVEDIGTEFNINAYTDEGLVKTTLVAGEAKVNALILKPNEQAVNNGKNIKITKVDPAEAIAWKNRLFKFDGTELADIMRQIGRWYNLDIVYEGKPASRSFSGTITKDVKLSEILRILEAGGIRFRIAAPAQVGGAKQLIVMP